MAIYLCPKNEEHWYPKDNEYEYCPICGVKLIQKCSNCGFEIIKPEYKFCVKCGTAYRKEESDEKE